jgi:F-type H+-transporting ATPase subunit b
LAAAFHNFSIATVNFRMNLSHATRRTRALCASAAVIALTSAPLFAQEAEHAANDSWMPTLYRVINFAIVVGVVYMAFGKTIGAYFADRATTIKKDLSDARAMKSDAEQQLASVKTKLSALPAELAAMKQRGEEDIAAEKLRLKTATAAERERLLEQTRREIELSSRNARRRLLDDGIERAMVLAKQRVERDITAEDQTRLIDDYTSKTQQAAAAAGVRA